MRWLAALALATVALAAPREEQVTNLPGLNFTLAFDHYSGYLKASATKQFHYWFTESQQTPSKDPLVLWLNGGPGCSSVGGLIEELGPFKVADFGKTVYLNKYAWNREVNLLFIESPAGVGYSYATDGNITTGDQEVAQNNYRAVLDFLRKFPEYHGRDFYITGESYGGIYLPTLGAFLAADRTNFPNFKGMAIGNGVLNFPNNYNTMVPLYYYHSLVREELYSRISSQCCNGNIPTCDIFGKFNDPPCRAIIVEALGGTDELDEYNLYSTCYLDSGSGDKRRHISNYMRRLAGLPERDHAVQKKSMPLCAQLTNTQTYMNRADVRAALHIPAFLPKWSDCNNNITNTYQTTAFDVTPYVDAISAAGVKILIYNGDVDTVCNHVMNRQFLDKIGRDIIGPEQVNQPWFYLGEHPDVAGFQTLYAPKGGAAKIDFLSVRGSGHFVPEDKPREALQMFVNWIRDTDYSNDINM